MLEGPWVEAFWVDLGTRLRSKSNFRRAPRRRAGSAEWSSLARFEQTVATVVREQLPSSWELGAVGASIAQRPVVVAVVVARSLLDSGNFTKSVLDACEGLVFRTDASVLASAAVSERSRTDQRSVVAFARLAPAASTEEIASAAAALTLAAASSYLGSDGSDGS